MGVWGGLSATVSFILVCITVDQLAITQTRFVDKMEVLQSNYTEVLKVKHEDFNGLVYLLHTEEYEGTPRQREMYTEDIDDTLNYLSLNYMSYGATPDPDSFAKSRPIFFGFAAFNCIVYAFLYVCLAVWPVAAVPQMIPVKAIYKVILLGCQYQIMMIYLCAEKETGELIMFYVPGDALLMNFFALFGMFCLAGCCAAAAQSIEVGGVAFGCMFCGLFALFSIPLYAIIFDYIPSFVNIMHSDSYSDYVIFNDEYYDKSWLAYELLGSSLIIDVVCFFLDICIGAVFPGL